MNLLILSYTLHRSILSTPVKNRVLADLCHTVWKVSLFEVFLTRIFPHSDCIRKFTE